jgi:hypothetical protein
VETTVETRCSLREFVGYARPTPRKLFILGVLLEIAYWPFFVLGTLFVFPWVIILLTISVAGVFAFLPLYTLPLLIPFLLYYAAVDTCGRLGLRYRVDAPRALEAEGRAPILYLRSFHYENSDRSLGGSRARYSFFENENDDEVLALALREVGPLVAVGRPGGGVPPLGAVRLYFRDEEWRRRVAELIDISRLLVIQPGYTDGLEEEMKIAKGLPPEKVIYSFLAWQHQGRRWRAAEYQMFSMQVRRIYGCRLPEKVGNAYFLYFTRSGQGGEGWTPHLVGLRGGRRLFFGFCSSLNLVLRLLNSEIVVTLLGIISPLGQLLSRLPIPRAFRPYSVPGVREALRPVLAERGMRLPVWRTALFVAGVVLYMCYAWSTPFIMLPGFPG